MRWLVHGNLTPAVAAALRQHGHTVQSASDAGIDAPAGAELLRAAQARQVDIITDDARVAQALFASRQRFTRSIVFLQLRGGAKEQTDAIDRLFQRYKRLSQRRLYTVTGTRVKTRQLPTG